MRALRPTFCPTASTDASGVLFVPAALLFPCAITNCPSLLCPAGTPADKLLQMLTDLLDGTLPNLQDIMLIQSSILEARDIYQPWRLGKQLLETKDLEVGCGLGVRSLLCESLVCTCLARVFREGLLLCWAWRASHGKGAEGMEHASA
jgi:hypothetical protein